MSTELRDMLAVLKVEPGDCGPDTGLEEAGLDSLALAELSLLLAERGVQVGQDELAATATLPALDQLIASRLPAR
ncbi:phosphopantetheine-binding protein [Actinomadura hibisca]|uniref:phosphopantetheine-binding protein n=1 Tax=Actinomadura hibisca TaxID=68565 RepID=UPI0008307C48|nr:phosphopantetheine-binding protein [Actinomadura hibisca]